MIEDPEEGGEGLAAASGGREQDRFALEDRRHAAQLGIGEIGEGRTEPVNEARMELAQQ